MDNKSRSVQKSGATPELLGQGGDRQRYSVAYGLGAVAGEGGSVFDSLPFAVAWHGWEVSQHREPGGAFHQCSDRGAVESEDQVTFPVSWHCPVVGLGGALGDHDLGADELAAPLPGPCSRDPAALARFADTPRVRV